MSEIQLQQLLTEQRKTNDLLIVLTRAVTDLTVMLADREDSGVIGDDYLNTSRFIASALGHDIDFYPELPDE